MSKYRIANSDNPLETTQNSTISPNRYIAENAFLREILPTATQYCSLAKPAVLNSGSGYSTSTQIVFPEPSFTGGITAVATPIFGLSNLSLNLEDGGSGHYVGDIYYVTSTNSSYATILVTQTDENGAIVSYRIPNSGFNFDNNNIQFTFSSVIKPRLFSRTVTPAIFAFVPDKFSIVDVNMTNYGSGYQTLNSDFKTTVVHTITANDTSGSGFYAITSARPSSEVVVDEDTGEFSIFRPQILINKASEPQILKHSYIFDKTNHQWIGVAMSGIEDTGSDTCEDPSTTPDGYDISHIAMVSALPAAFASNWDDLDPERTVILTHTKKTISTVKAEDIAKLLQEMEDLMVDSYRIYDAFELESITARNGARSGSFNTIDKLDPTWRGPLSGPGTLEEDLTRFLARRERELQIKLQQEILQRIQDGKLSTLVYQHKLRGSGRDNLFARVLKRIDPFYKDVNPSFIIENMSDILDRNKTKDFLRIQRILEHVIRSKETAIEIRKILILVKNSKPVLKGTKKMCQEALERFLSGAKGKKALIGTAIIAAAASASSAFADDEYLNTITYVAGTAIELIPPDPIEIALDTISGTPLGDSEIDFSYDRFSETFDKIFEQWLNDEISDADLEAIFNNTTIIQDNLRNWTPDGKTFPFGDLPGFHRDFTDIETYLTLENFLERIRAFKETITSDIFISKRILETYMYRINETETNLTIEVEDCENYCPNQDNSKSSTLSMPVKTSINLDPIILHYGSDGIIRKK